MPRLPKTIRLFFSLTLLALIAVASTDSATPVASASEDGVQCFIPNFKRAPGYNLSTEPAAFLEFVAGHFNGDGKLDVAGLQRGYEAGSPKLASVYLGDGFGSFSAPVHYAIGTTNTTPYDINAGDFNGDDKTDLIVFNNGGETGGVGGACNSRISVLFGNGDGTFATPLTYSTTLCGYEIDVADFNVDGKDDILVASTPSYPPPQTFLLGLSEGNGFFGAATVYVPSGTKLSDVAPGDFNGDGKPDVAISLYEPTLRLEVYLNDGTGGLLSPALIESGTAYRPMKTADFNGDGKADLIAFNGNNYTLALFLSNGAGGFTKTVYTLPANDYTERLFIGDYNGDGKPDVVKGITVFINDGMGVFTKKTLNSIGTDVREAGDFNNDGRTDLLRLIHNNYVFNLGFLNYINAFAVSLSDCSGNNTRIIDYDGDGITDIAVWRPSTGEWIIRNSSDASTRTQVWGGSSFGDIPVPGDYEGDGKADLAVFRPSVGGWYVLRSLDGQAYGMQWGASGDVPVPADYDGDGRTDIAVWRPSNGGWYVFRSASGTMAAIAWGTNGDKPAQADYDGDHKADFAVFRPSNGYWYIYRSSDNAIVSQAWGTNGDKPVPGDYDSDGRADLMVYRPGTGIWWLRRSFNGASRALSVINPQPAVDQPVPGDYSGDGTIDTVTRRSGDNYWILSPLSDNSLPRITWGVSTDIQVSTPYRIE